MILSSDNGNRPDVSDVVLVLTDGKSKDDVKEPARKIHELNALV